MHIYCVHIDQLLDETLFQEMLQYVSPEKKEKIQRFRKPIDAVRSLLGDLIIRYILCKHYGFYNNEIGYGYQELGKPYLLQHPHLHFSISHSGDWVVGVVSNNLVGIDIEKITEVKEDLASLALCAEEHQKLQALHKMDQNPFFFKLWTLKESYVKATGTGLSEGLNTLEITIHQENISMKKNEKPIHAYFETMELQQKHQLSLCSLSKNLHRDMRLFLFNEFTEEVKSLLGMSKAIDTLLNQQ
ncbi:MAG: 4'-phosphopantetheinyl transferase family protein [Chryseobacterium jejuense]|uniref:4'-phosphopantetheinyl transferase family protein n=1 Tax=Chryseobacterium jejuense TaxID=445960 RepID=UPI003D142C64